MWNQDNRSSKGRQPKNPHASGRSLGDIINSPSFDIVSRNKVIEIVQEIFSNFVHDDAIVVEIFPPGWNNPQQLFINPNWNPDHKHFYNIVLEFMGQVFQSPDHFREPAKIRKFLKGLFPTIKIKQFESCGGYFHHTMKLLVRFCCPGDPVMIAFEKRKHLIQTNDSNNSNDSNSIVNSGGLK